jgi:hypothetical protein
VQQVRVQGQQALVAPKVQVQRVQAWVAPKVQVQRVQMVLVALQASLQAWVWVQVYQSGCQNEGSAFY